MNSTIHDVKKVLESVKSVNRGTKKGVFVKCLLIIDEYDNHHYLDLYSKSKDNLIPEVCEDF